MFLCVLGLVGFCLVHEGSDEMRKMPYVHGIGIASVAML